MQITTNPEVVAETEIVMSCDNLQNANIISTNKQRLFNQQDNENIILSNSNVDQQHREIAKSQEEKLVMQQRATQILDQIKMVRSNNCSNITTNCAKLQNLERKQIHMQDSDIQKGSDVISPAAETTNIQHEQCFPVISRVYPCTGRYHAKQILLNLKNKSKKIKKQPVLQQATQFKLNHSRLFSHSRKRVQNNYRAEDCDSYVAEDNFNVIETTNEEILLNQFRKLCSRNNTGIKQSNHLCQEISFLQESQGLNTIEVCVNSDEDHLSSYSEGHVIGQIEPFCRESEGEQVPEDDQMGLLGLIEQNEEEQNTVEAIRSKRTISSGVNTPNSTNQDQLNCEEQSSQPLDAQQFNSFNAESNIEIQAKIHKLHQDIENMKSQIKQKLNRRNQQMKDQVFQDNSQNGSIPEFQDQDDEDGLVEENSCEILQEISKQFNVSTENTMSQTQSTPTQQNDNQPQLQINIEGKKQQSHKYNLRSRKE